MSVYTRSMGTKNVIVMEMVMQMGGVAQQLTNRLSAYVFIFVLSS